MDFCAVSVFLCMLIAQTSCYPVTNGDKDGALNTTIQEIRQKVQFALCQLAEPEVLPNISCPSLNLAELVNTHLLCSLSCYMLELSKHISELSKHLKIISQNSLDAVQRMSNCMVPQECSLPPFKQAFDSYVYAKCLLQFVDETFKQSNFLISVQKLY